MTKPRTTKPGTVRKIVPPVIPSEPEKAEIEVHDGDHLYKEIRIDNTLHDDGLPSAISNIAEQSRPYRSFKECNRPDPTGPGRKRLHEAIPAVRVN